MKNTSRKPYIYKVTNLETGRYYIGSQCSGKTIGVNYFTSSTNKNFWDDFKNYREEKYKIEIIKEFEDPKKCGRAENYIIRNYMLKKDGLCLNRFYRCGGKKVFSRVGIPAPNKGIPHTDEARKKMSEAHKGQSPSEETRKRMSIAKKGTHLSEETRKKLSISKKSRPTSNRIKISIEGTFFNSLTEASKYYKMSDRTIGYWLKTKKHNAFYVEK